MPDSVLTLFHPGHLRGLNEADGPRRRFIHSVHPCHARALLFHAPIALNGLPEIHCRTACTVCSSPYSGVYRVACLKIFLTSAPFPDDGLTPGRGPQSGGLQSPSGSFWRAPPGPFLGHALVHRSATLVAPAAASPLSRDTMMRQPARCPAAGCPSHSGGERASYLYCACCFFGAVPLPTKPAGLGRCPYGR